MGSLETLRRRRDIDELFRNGNRRRGRWLSMVAVHRPTGARRVLLVTSRKVGGAVVRNRVRRRMREAFRGLRDRLPEHADVALIASPIASQASYSELASEMEALMRRGGLLGGQR